MKVKRLLPVCVTLLAAAAAVCWVLFFEKARVYGHSMEPALKDGQTVLVDKLAYRLGEPERFDVIVFRDWREEGRYYMKRIVGLPGETVQIADGRVTIDGVLLEEPSEREEIRDARRASEPVVLGQAEYFVLGDNRNGSSDSRDSDIGNVSAEQIIGRVVFWP
mgnify:FL=1